MNYRDPYRSGPSENQLLRQRLAEVGRIAETALREQETATRAQQTSAHAQQVAIRARDAALREKDEALRTRDTALQEKDEALRMRATALHERDEALRERDALARQRTEVPKDSRSSDPAEGDARLTALIADIANVRRLRDELIARARAEERSNGARALASVYDDLSRSLSANPDRDSPWYQGHKAILAKLLRTLEGMGVTSVGAVGDRFDPALHEAIGTGEGEPGTIAEVILPGFVLDDGTLVRPAVVRIAQ